MAPSLPIALSLFAAVVATTGPALLHADGFPAWTSIGATGMPDETDAQKVAFHTGGAAGIKATLSRASVTLRYNVTATADITRDAGEDEVGQGVFLDLSAIVRDNGPHARVITRLIRVNIGWGDPVGTQVLATIDSDDPSLEPADGFARYIAPVKWAGHHVRSLSFYEEAYFVEVQLIKTAPDGDPRIKAVTVFHDQ